ncbi:hypothetical protein IH992_31365 [Candidatus Poribacteria bacterium]|nr:hypothetical protein [Candidatus Poribacteria bacterium]
MEAWERGSGGARKEEHQEENYEGRVIVRVGKDGSLEVKELWKDQDKDYGAFLGILAVHKRMAELKDEAYEEKRNQK